MSYFIYESIQVPKEFLNEKSDIDFGKKIYHIVWQIYLKNVNKKGIKWYA